MQQVVVGDLVREEVRHDPNKHRVAAEANEFKDHRNTILE